MNSSVLGRIEVMLIETSSLAVCVCRCAAVLLNIISALFFPNYFFASCDHAMDVPRGWMISQSKL